MSSMKASERGLVAIKQAVRQKVWKVFDHRWLVEASKILEPDGYWQLDGPYAYGCSLQTWERFLKGVAIRDRSFVAFCQVLGLSPQSVIDSPSDCQQNYGQAPDAPTFFGRKRELATLEQWIFQERYQLIDITGFAGSGKTRLLRGGLTLQKLPFCLGDRVRNEFECLIWRRIDSLSPIAMLSELIVSINNGEAVHLPTTVTGLAAQLLYCLRQRRCLLILDDVDSILSGGQSAGKYQQSAQAYGDILRRLGESHHQSCVVLSGRESIQDMEEMEGIFAVRSLRLKGLDTAAAQAIFKHLSQTYQLPFQGSKSDWTHLVSLYSGNPLMLEAVARQIFRHFNGCLADFLARDRPVFGKVRSLLDWHVNRLSKCQKEVLYHISAATEPISISELKVRVTSEQVQKRLPDILDSLERQIPIGTVASGLSTSPIFAKYFAEQGESTAPFSSETCLTVLQSNKSKRVRTTEPRIKLLQS